MYTLAPDILAPAFISPRMNAIFGTETFASTLLTAGRTQDLPRIAWAPAGVTGVRGEETEQVQEEGMDEVEFWDGRDRVSSECENF